MSQPEPLLRPKMPELDSVRGIAILSVVSYHGFFWSSGLEGFLGVQRLFVRLTGFGWLGVHLFFVLSGFLITGILEDSKGSGGYFRKFYARRALRILPAFYGMLAVLAFVPGQNWSYLLLSFFYLSNLAPLLHIQDTYGMFWSLAAEEHFYLFWPLITFFLSRRRLLIAACFLFLASPLLRMAWFHDPLPNGFHGFTWLVLDGFAAGAILALLARDPFITRTRFAALSVIAIAVSTALIIFGTPFGILSRRTMCGASLMLTAAHLLFLGIVGLALFLGTGKWKSLVNFRVLSFYGKISYGLYLIHWLVFVAYDAFVGRYAVSLAAFHGNFGLLTLRFLCVLTMATLLAGLSRRYYEEWFLRLKTRFT